MNNTSFRDPNGKMFYSDGVMSRIINKSYFPQYEHLIESGLYDEATREKLLIPHVEVESNSDYHIIQPTIIPFISYPYEWCFTQLKEAALLVLNLQLMAMKYDMILKDASAFNVQFLNGEPIWIDTLSFEKYSNTSWVAYKQFCQHFLSPLALMSYCDHRLLHLMKSNIDGIPLDLTSNILPDRSWLNMGLLFHIHLHSRIGTVGENAEPPHMTKFQMFGLIDSLKTTIENLNFKMKKHDWGNYYNENNYSQIATESKINIVSKYLSNISVGTLWDIGGNVGHYTRIATEKGFGCILLDSDFECIERVKRNNLKNIFPLWMDINNPSSGIGWRNKERSSLFDRGPPDTTMALALIHHLVIGNNITLGMMSDFFKDGCRNNLIVEFIPRSDIQVQKLLLHREDIFFDYTQENFELEFSKNFIIKDRSAINDSDRILYLMEKK